MYFEKESLCFDWQIKQETSEKNKTDIITPHCHVKTGSPSVAHTLPKHLLVYLISLRNTKSMTDVYLICLLVDGAAKKSFHKIIECSR